MSIWTEYKGYLIYEVHKQYHVYEGLAHDVKRGSRPPKWLSGPHSTIGIARAMVDSYNPNYIHMPTPKATRLLVKTKPSPMEARLVTVDNLEEIAAWVGGSVKGIKLDRHHQVVGWYDQNFSTGDDCTAEVGDWVVKFGPMAFSPFTEDKLRNLFEIVEP